jgi:hypothetical protein
MVGAGGEAVIWALAYCFPALLVQLFVTCNSGGLPTGVIAALGACCELLTMRILSGADMFREDSRGIEI